MKIQVLSPSGEIKLRLKGGIEIYFMKSGTCMMRPNLREKLNKTTTSLLQQI